ncbi:cupin domain-containing protein [Streptomyces sp. NPDC058411]|uniref:cupin domain-containing protein n=1 Tax=Streptomyces sp. NPDC058411 TaxID=3346485 RepID=UPI0036567352
MAITASAFAGHNGPAMEGGRGAVAAISVPLPGPVAHHRLLAPVHPLWGPSRNLRRRTGRQPCLRAAAGIDRRERPVVAQQESSATIMSIEIIELAQAERFQPVGHHGVGPVHLFGGERYEGAVTVALSHYLPGGQADLSPVPAETLYIVLSGTLTLTDADGSAHALNALDGARLTAGTPRSVENLTNLPASMLVIRPNPAARVTSEPEARS